MKLSYLKLSSPWMFFTLVASFCFGQQPAVNVGASCKEEIACKLESRATSLADNDPMALEVTIFLLADAVSHRPYLSIEERLRSGLELYRKPQQILNDRAYQAFAVSNNGQWLAAGDDDGKVLFFSTAGRNFPWQSQEFSGKFNTSVVALLFNPTGKDPGRYLAYSSEKDEKKGDQYGHVTIIDTTNMTAVAEDIRHNSTPRKLIWTPNGEMLATISSDPVIRVWDFAGSKHLEIPANSRKILDARFTLDGKSLIAVTADGKMQTFSLADPLHPLVDDIGFSLHCAALSPNNDWIAACGENHNLAFIKTQREHAAPSPTPRKPSNPAQHKLAEQGEQHPSTWAYHDRNNLNTVTFGRLNNWVAAGSVDGSFHLFHLDSKEEIVHVNDAGAITALAFSGDSRWVAVARQDGVRVLEAATGIEIARLNHSTQVTAVEFSADSTLVITRTDDGKVTIWPVIPASEKFRVRRSKINDVAMDLNGHVSLVAGQNFTVFDTREGRDPLEPVTEKLVKKAVFSDNGELFVTTSGLDAKVYNTSRSAKLSRFEWMNDLDRVTGGPQQDGPISAMVFSHDSTLVAIGDENGKVRTYYSSTSGNDVYKVLHHGGMMVTSIGFSQDDEYLAVGTGDKRLYLYESQAGESEHAPKVWIKKPHADLRCGEPISVLRFSLDSKILAAGCANKLGIFDIGETKVTPVVLKGEVAAIDFDSKGHIFVGTDEGAIHVLNFAGVETDQIRNPEKQIKDVRFDDKTNSVKCLSIGHSSDVVEPFAAVYQFPATAGGLVRQVCSQIPYPKRSELGEYNREENFHDFCAPTGPQPEH